MFDQIERCWMLDSEDDIKINMGSENILSPMVEVSVSNSMHKVCNRKQQYLKIILLARELEACSVLFSALRCKLVFFLHNKREKGEISSDLYRAR